MTSSVGRISVLLCGAAFGLGVAVNFARAQEGKLVGESKSWKVEVVSAEFGLAGEEVPWDKGKQFTNPGPGRCFLFLKLNFEYRGPSGDVPAPRVTLMNDQGETFSNSGNLNFLAADTFKWDMTDWLMSATHNNPKDLKSLALKTGEGPGAPWIEFQFVIPIGSKGFRLVFGGEEIPGVTIDPTKAK